MQKEGTSESKCESVWCKIKTHNNESVANVYRSQSFSEAESAKLFTATHVASEYDATIIADFNYPSINWDTFTGVAATEMRF